MNQATRRFYLKYQLLTFAVPAYLTAVVILGLGWLTFHPPDGAARRIVEILAGVLFFLACAGVYEILARLGFRLVNMESKAVMLEPQAKDKLQAAISAPSESKPDIVPVTIELGPVPLLMVSAGRPARLWISTHTIQSFTVRNLSLLMAHELAHLRQNDLLNRVLASGLFWWTSSLIALRIPQSPLISLAIMLIAASLFMRILAIIRRISERNADRRAVEMVDVADYARAQAKYLRMFKRGDQPRLMRDRLGNLDLTETEIKMIVEELNGLS